MTWRVIAWPFGLCVIAVGGLPAKPWLLPRPTRQTARHALDACLSASLMPRKTTRSYPYIASDAALLPKIFLEHQYVRLRRSKSHSIPEATVAIS